VIKKSMLTPSIALIGDYDHCRFGLNPEHAAKFESGSLRITGVDQNGEARVVELENHPFFFGTQFQPERAAPRRPQSSIDRSVCGSR
jgi:CTP synthase (UTP-ammonia lyase)